MHILNPHPPEPGSQPQWHIPAYMQPLADFPTITQRLAIAGAYPPQAVAWLQHCRGLDVCRIASAMLQTKSHASTPLS